ncbi:MAG: putative hydrolase, CocE/NonD family [Promethearchaeota archaeon]|nr:MAG: putative hydrolase, CocE/NonD family [Candidatus Lokiarchaeota archaeon]
MSKNEKFPKEESNPYHFENVPSRKTFSGRYKKSSQYLTMRDGVKIAIEVVLPEDLGKTDKIPTVLMQTRYWRNYKLRIPFRWLLNDIPDKKMLYSYLTSRGYGLVTVDVRGTGASFGTRPYPWHKNEVEDGRDIMDWIVEQFWSNGDVVAMGGSYVGVTSEYAASLNHPAFKAVFPYSNQWDVYSEVAFPGGLYNHYFIRIWGELGEGLDQNSSKKFLSLFPIFYFFLKGVQPVETDENEELLEKAVKEHKKNVYVFQNEGEVDFRDEPLTGQEVDNADTVGVFTEQANIEKSNVPFLTWAGWLDGAAAENIINRFMNYKNPMRAVIGDFDHGMKRRANPYFPLTYDIIPEKEEQMKSWFDFFDLALYGEDSFSEKVLYYYTMGEEKWKKTEKWPPMGQEMHRFYLNENSTLTGSKPNKEEGEDKYSVDFNITSGDGNRWHVHYAQKMNYTKREKIDPNLLVYDTLPLEEDMEITGHPIMTLNLASTHQDGAIIVYLEDVDEEGNITYLTEGEFRFIHRKISETPPYKIDIPYHSFKKADALPLVPGEVAEIKFGLLATSVLVRKGHKLRLAICGADKDTFLRYPSEGNPVLSIKRSKETQSFIDIPVIKRY